METICFCVFELWSGNIVLVSKNDRLIRLTITREEQYRMIKYLRNLYPGGVETTRPFKDVLNQLARYFRGQQVEFTVPVDITGLGDFTRTVLEATRKIPYGQVTTYGSIGKLIGYPRGARAVGQALGRNPVPIIIPCHRVIKGDGSIGGFSMRLRIKERLLTLEGIRLDDLHSFILPVR